MLLHIFDGSIDARWLELSKRQGCIELLLGAFKVDLLVVNACSLSCFLAALCSMWMAFLVLSTWESVVSLLGRGSDACFVTIRYLSPMIGVWPLPSPAAKPDDHSCTMVILLELVVVDTGTLRVHWSTD